MAAIQLTSQVCQKCRYVISYEPKRTYHEECLRVNWEEILQMKDSCLLCLKNYKAYTNFTSKRPIGGEIHLTESTHVIASKYTPTTSSGIQHLLFQGCSGDNILWFLTAWVSNTAIDERGYQRALWTPGPQVSFVSRMLQLKNRLHECRGLHEGCKPTNAIMPTRLVEITRAREFSVRLVNSDDLEAGQAQYTALSHCWGSIDEAPTKTTVRNLKAHANEIPWNNLPQTFRDAIRVTNALDMRYIWIDSLCIIQDDVKDWQREAARMAGVFGGSELTIAAADSYNSHIGLFLDSIAPPLIYFKESDSSLRMVRFHRADFEQLASTCLGVRGWVFQELILSQRKVYFGQDQLYWHCQSLSISEDDSDKRLGKRLFPRWSIHTTDNYRTWWHPLVRNYSEKKFTYQTDRVAAMAGIIKWYQDESQQTPVLGMWKESLMHDLAWVLDFVPNALTKKSLIPGLPSWTWLHWDYPVRFWSPKDAQQQEGVSLQVLECAVTWVGEAITSEIKASRLIVRGLLKKLELKHAILFPGVRLMVGDYSWEHCHIGVDELGTYNLTENDASRFLWADCLLLRATRDELLFLLVEHLFDGEEYPVYRRIGIGKVDIAKEDEMHQQSIFFDAEPTSLELV